MFQNRSMCPLVSLLLLLLISTCLFVDCSSTSSSSSTSNSNINGGTSMINSNSDVIQTGTMMKITTDDKDDEFDYKEQISLLSKQVSALLNKRREDFELLEENIKKSLIKNSEMVKMRKELEELQHEVQHLRSGSGNNVRLNTLTQQQTNEPPLQLQSNGITRQQQHQQSNQETNDHLTVKWLSDAVSELRTEFAEMQYSHNVSVMSEQRQAIQNELKLLRTDMLNMNKELEGVRTEQLKYEATLGQLMEEVTSVRDSERATAVICAKAKSQLKAAQLEWSYNWQQLTKTNGYDKHSQKYMKNDVQSDMILSRKSRHQRILREHIIKLEKSHANITKQQTLLQDKLYAVEELLNEFNINKKHSAMAGHRGIGKNIETRLQNIETQMKQITKNLNTVEMLEQSEATINNELVHDNNLLGRINKLETEQKQTTLSVFNISRQVSSFDRLHRSILELLESVETLENKVDKTVPDFRKEISQLEFNMAQTLSEIALIKEDQSNTLQSIKTLNTGVTTLRDKVELDHETLEQLNITVSLLQASNYIQNSKLHDHILKTESSQLTEGYANLNGSMNVVQELEEVENEYHSIINKLPHDCSYISGQNGLYLISPGAGEPVMVMCHEGWTTVQRRRDGSIDFNRNWEEYSRGFGTASGEFWIGNRVLNRLTKDNCTRLRIDMVDIYGKSYHAEYDNFNVENASNGYRLHVAGYSGNSSDALDYQNRMEFSTIDNDRDISNTHCASNYEGGWWFSHCQHANLNGKYNLGLTWFDSSRNEWIAVATSEMKVKRREDCEMD